MMPSFRKIVVLLTFFYALVALITFFVGSMNEEAGYALFLGSSLIFSAKIVYEVWREAKPLKEIKYPAEQSALDERFSEVLREVSPEKTSPIRLISRLQQILAKKLSVRLNVTKAEAEKIMQSPEALRSLGYDKLANLISDYSLSTRKRNGRTELLNAILKHLEED